jgi:putative acetyltransferase
MILSATPKWSAPALRPYLPKDLAILLRIVRASIEQLAAEDYSENQIKAWIEAFDDEPAFAKRLESGLTLVATLEGLPAGFIALKGKDQIDLLYVAPGVARRGVATTLVDAIEKLTQARGVTALQVDASDCAVPLFSLRGYEPQRRSSVSLGDEWLANTSMTKTFGASPAPTH